VRQTEERPQSLITNIITNSMEITLQNKSLLDLRSEFPECFYTKQDAWYDNEDFAKEKITGTWDVSLEPVRDSFNKTWDEQQRLLKKGDEVSPVAVLMAAMIKHKQETGKYAFNNCYVRTSSRDSGGRLVHVGSFDDAGASVAGGRPGSRFGLLGVSFSRSESCTLNSESCVPDEAFSLGEAIKLVREAGYEVKEITLQAKFQAFREKHGQGNGKEYWNGLAKIAEEYFEVDAKVGNAVRRLGHTCSIYNGYCMSGHKSGGEGEGRNYNQN